MRILLIGAAGMLGSDLLTTLSAKNMQCICPSLEELDITNPTQVAEWVTQGWDWVVNCAAYTAVDKAETERDLALAINGLGPGYLGRACAMASARFLHVSTDFVFDGLKSEPYLESDPTNPLGMYGVSKRAGEEAAIASGARVWIVRTSWLYGPNGNSFPRTMLRAALAGKDLRVVADQVGTPTYTMDLARVMADLMMSELETGIYHAAGPDVMSWCDFAKLTLSLAGVDAHVEPISTASWPTPAPRPAYSALSFTKLMDLGVEPMRATASCLRDFIKRLPAS